MHRSRERIREIAARFYCLEGRFDSAERCIECRLQALASVTDANYAFVDYFDLLSAVTLRNQ